MTKQLKLYKKITTLFVVVVALAATFSSLKAAEIMTFEKIKPDKSCGPRCLSVLLRLRDGEKEDCGIKCIYEIIGKESFSLVNMKDLRDAALKLGFTAKAYKLKFDQLRKLKGYYIVPIGKGMGTKDNPVHFILVERIQDDYIIFLDNESLETKALSVAEFADLWNGYALVIDSSRKMRYLEKKNVLTANPKENKEVSDFYEVKDFGYVDKGSTLTYTFTIPYENIKEFQVRIVKKSCSCIECELGRDIYDNITLKVGYKIDGVGWQKAYVVVEIMPSKTIRKYGLVAFGKNSYKVKPKNCYISAPEGGNIEYPFEVEYFTGPEGIVKFDKLKCDNKNISIKNVESYQVQGAGSVIRFNFKFLLLFNACKLNNRSTIVTEKLDLIFNTSGGDRTISMDFFAKIGKDRYKVHPKKVFNVTSKSDLSPVTTRIKCQFFDKPIPDISLKADGKLPLKYSLTNDEESYYITMEFMKEGVSNMPLGLSKENLYLMHQNKNIPKIIIPIRIFVKE